MERNIFGIASISAFNGPYSGIGINGMTPRDYDLDDTKILAYCYSKDGFIFNDFGPVRNNGAGSLSCGVCLQRFILVSITSCYLNSLCTRFPLGTLVI